MGRGLRILGFWFGRAGVTAGGWGASVAQRFMPRHGHAGRCPDPPRNLRFLGFSVCCRAFGAWRCGKSQAQAATIAARSRQAEAMLVRERCAMGTLGAAQTCQGTSGSLDSPFAAALLERGAAENRRLKRRPSPRRAVSSNQPRSETYRRSRAATKAAWAPSID